MKPTAKNMISNLPTFRLKHGKVMSINKQILRTLDNPSNIQFWWGSTERVLLIGAAQVKTSLSISVSTSYYKPKRNLRIENRSFLNAMLKISGWSRDLIYVVHGEYIPELSMIAFKLDDAVITTHMWPETEPGPTAESGPEKEMIVDARL